MSNKKLAFILTTSVLVAVFFLSQYKNDIEVSAIENGAVSSSNIASHQDITSDVGVRTQQTNNLDSSESKLSKHALTPAERVEKDQWLVERGHVELETGVGIAEYSTYDIGALKKLANEGDARAVEALAVNEWKQKGYDAAIQIYTEAAAKGSTVALSSIGQVIDTAMYRNAKTPEEKHAAALEVLSYGEAANLRGDRLPKIQNESAFIQLNKIVLTDNDRKEIDTRAKEIYDQIQNKRYELNLGDFDNSVPESVQKYYIRLETALAH